MTLAELASRLRPNEDHELVLGRLAATDWRTTQLDIENAQHRDFAARATAGGAALFYSFGNFCAIAAHPDADSVVRVNLMKGRPADQVGSVTTTRDRVDELFDWSALPDGVTRDRVLALVDELYERGPMGFRGPAAQGVPEHLTSVDGGMRTTQIIAPGYRCPSNDLIAAVLDLTGEDYLFITSANVSSTVTGNVEAAHYDLAGMQRDFGDREGIVLIGHRDDAAIRATYADHVPMSTSILAFHKLAPGGGLTLERHGSLDAEIVREVVARHGFELALGERAQTRLPLRAEAERAR